MHSPFSITKRNDLLILPDIATPEDRALEKKRIRRHLILNAIREFGPLSRADITRQLGFNSQTVKTVVTELVLDGLVIEDDEERVMGMGRPPTPCRLNPRAGMVCGLAVTRSHAMAILVDLAGEELGRRVLETPEFSSPIAEAGWIKDFALHFLAESPRELPPLAGLAVGVPRRIETDAQGSFNVLVPSPRSTTGAITRAIHRELNLPVLANCQARMNAVGATWYGPARRFKHMVYLDLEETPRLVVVTNGRLSQGALGRAGELWEMIIPGSVDPGSPGRRRRVGQMLSSDALLEKAMLAGLEHRTLHTLATAAREGNEVASNIFNEYCVDLADVIAMLATLFNPDGVVLGGAVAFEARDLVEGDLRKCLEVAMPMDALMRMEVEFSPQGPCADPAACAAAYALHHIFAPTHFDLIDLL